MIKYIVLSAVLTGCACDHPPVLPQVPISTTEQSPASGKEMSVAKTYVDLDQSLLADCSPLADLEIKNPVGDDVLKRKAKDVAVYYECANRHKRLSELVKEYWNVPAK